MLAAASVATVASLPVWLTGALAVQMRADLGFDESGLGLTVAAFFGTSSLLSTPGGRAAERLGAAASTRLAAAAGGVSLLLIAVAARSLPLLLGCLVVAGAANGLAQPATNLLIAHRIPPERLGLAFGVKQSAIPMSTVLGGLAVPLVALTVGWRWAFVGAGLLSLVLAWSDPGASGDAVVRRGARRGEDDTRLGALVLLGAGAALGAAAAGTLGSFLVSAAVDAGIDEGPAGLLAFACAACGIATRVALGARADRRGRGHLAVTSMLMAVGSVTYLAIGSGEPAAIVAGGLLAYCTAWAWPGLMNLSVVRANPGAPGAATGITQTGTYVGAVVGPLLFGVAADVWGYGWGFTGSAVSCALGAGAMWGARRAIVADRDRRAALAV